MASITHLGLAVFMAMCVYAMAATDHCIDSTGISRPLNSKWIQADKQCQCVNPASYSPMMRGKVQAKVRCLYNGCADRVRWLLLKEGSTFTLSNGNQCLCKKGPSRQTSKITLYHALCSDGMDNYEITFD